MRTIKQQDEYCSRFIFIDKKGVKNRLKLNSFIINNGIILTKELKEIINTIEVVYQMETTDNYIELFAQSYEKEQYLKLYKNGDYTFFSDTFNY